MAGSSRIMDDFADLMLPFTVAELDEMPSPICALTVDRRIAYVNPAWVTNATTNGAQPWEESCGIGMAYPQSIPPVLRPFYEDLFATAAERQALVERDYDCSTPQLRRDFRMRVHPCRSGVLVIVHSLLSERAHDAVYVPQEALYRNDDGLLVLCSNCRRSRRAGTGTGATAIWDWVPDYAAAPPRQTSHSLCRLCAVYYYS